MGKLMMRVPLDVPPAMRASYRENYSQLTHGTGRLMLMAGDQKVEHLNGDFYGPDIASDDADPEHFFRIASQARIGAFATQLGLVARYGMDYAQIPYLVKLNSKTNLVETEQRDPASRQWQTMEQLARFRESSGLKILAVGYTIYPGSDYEAEMLTEAARLIFEAHHQGLVTVIWAYPRGRAVAEERDPDLIAGVAGVAACLGADFVKVNYPEAKDNTAEASARALKEAVLAAGRTGLICAGGKETSAEEFLTRQHQHIHIGGAAGNATGRNIHQRPLAEAVRFCNAISAITLDEADVGEAMDIYRGTSAKNQEK
jgi:fructose-bisphosphate aldolase / 6-deoxy-5-ketofructose 1-phosphate synthase